MVRLWVQRVLTAGPVPDVMHTTGRTAPQLPSRTLPRLCGAGACCLLGSCHPFSPTPPLVTACFSCTIVGNQLETVVSQLPTAEVTLMVRFRVTLDDVAAQGVVTVLLPHANFLEIIASPSGGLLRLAMSGHEGLRIATGGGGRVMVRGRLNRRSGGPVLRGTGA